MSLPPLVWQEQVGVSGCGIACVGMITGLPYARIVDMAPDFCGEKCGVEDKHLDQLLAELGYFVRRLERVKWFSGSIRRKWPVPPFAERHLVSVFQTRRDIYDHYVVMAEDGTVYDPADPALKPSQLSRYAKVNWIAGVVKF